MENLQPPRIALQRLTEARDLTSRRFLAEYAAVKINILLNRALVVDVWLSAQGEVHARGHDIDPRSVVMALGRVAWVMRQQLRERGEEPIDLDTEIKSLVEVVYAMGERLCPPGEDALSIEIGEQAPASELS